MRTGVLYTQMISGIDKEIYLPGEWYERDKHNESCTSANLCQERLTSLHLFPFQ